MEPGSLLMERKMLRSIRRRAERLAAQPPESALAPAGPGGDQR